MKNKKQIIEDALLSGKSIDELIKIKMKEEIKNAFKKVSTKFEKKKVYDIKSVPKSEIFGKKSVFKKFNKQNNTISYINGMQAEALLGMDTISREKLLKGEIEVFSTDNAFVKFEYAEIISRS
ncbi:hypothetical protein IJ707_07280 [bacterium]|nr:hypothetical protein [bacterium]